MSQEINSEDKQEKDNEDFPGYPHYPAKEDILNPANNTERVDVDLENISRSPNSVRAQEREDVKKPGTDDISPFDGIYSETDDDLQIVEGTDADVTEDDLLILESEGGEIVSKEEDLITTDSINRLASEDLDMPGTELDDANEAIGEEDEENNYYSLGGDKEDNLESEHE